MARSPIEMMVDKACGITAEDLARPAPKPRDLDADTKALMAVGTAAVKWAKVRDSGKLAQRVKAETALFEAAKVLAATGW
jgi:hypothetical protein